MRFIAALGTRPEVIKLAPVIHALRMSKAEVQVCVSGQHRDLVDPLLDFFGIEADHRLNVRRTEQSLGAMTGSVMSGVAEVIARTRADAVLVHGDTATTMAACVAGFLARVPVAHVEAGLRTGDLSAPWPEEACRRVTDLLAQWYFAPTEGAKLNLLAEGVPEQAVHVTGNTVIDALHMVQDTLRADETLRTRLQRKFSFLDAASRTILVTGHRRENFGAAFREVCRALRSVALAHPEVCIVYPVHLNPNVRAPAHALLSGVANIHLIEPQSYVDFVYLMQRAYLIVTDSGGVQEEAPALGKPLLITRACTERPEAVQAGAARLVGCDEARLIRGIEQLLTDARAYQRMAQARTLFGDGRAGARIAQILLHPARAQTRVPSPIKLEHVQR